MNARKPASSGAWLYVLATIVAAASISVTLLLWIWWTR